MTGEFINSLVAARILINTQLDAFIKREIKAQSENPEAYEDVSKEDFLTWFVEGFGDFK